MYMYGCKYVWATNLSWWIKGVRISLGNCCSVKQTQSHTKSIFSFNIPICEVQFCQGCSEMLYGASNVYSVQSYVKWDHKKGWGHRYASTCENSETFEKGCFK